jgi:two-component system phosphate regulon sensor histidine kinase PhoR
MSHLSQRFTSSAARLAAGVRGTRLFWKLYATYLIAVVLCAGMVGVLAVGAAQSLYRQHAQDDLKSRAELAQGQIVPLLDQPAQLQSLVHQLGLSSNTRITVIAGGADRTDAPGTVLADSENDPATMANHDTPDRPEVLAALSGSVGRVIRRSETEHQQMLYVAIPVTGAGGVSAVIRTALPLARVNAVVASLADRIILGTAVVAVLVALLGLAVSRSLSRRLRAIQAGAQRYAAGDFSHEVRDTPADEIGGVAASLNVMALHLSETIDSITEERNQREAVLAGMTEGVVAVDDGTRVITCNAAAGGLLGIDPEGALGHKLLDLVRNVSLHEFVDALLRGRDSLEVDLTLAVGEDRHDVQVHGAPLGAADDGGIDGAVIVLNDLTRLRQYEAIRRDFVANVSHEIKTPVTSIKGFAETLLDGALDDREDAERFLRIIAGQSDRLSAIIEDLLSLSNLESEGAGAVALERGSVLDVLQVAVDVCGLKAADKQISLELECPADLYAEINPPLLEQAVVNLIDNAVKYGPAGSSVEVSAALEPAGLVIRVRDHGPGIEREHLSRLFERFYRVDKARSRDMGGTGLGLSIVKHIAAAHNGTVAVQSALGLGSTFSITLPA